MRATFLLYTFSTIIIISIAAGAAKITSRAIFATRTALKRAYNAFSPIAQYSRYVGTYNTRVYCRYINTYSIRASANKSGTRDAPRIIRAALWDNVDHFYTADTHARAAPAVCDESLVQCPSANCANAVSVGRDVYVSFWMCVFVGSW